MYVGHYKLNTLYEGSLNSHALQGTQSVGIHDVLNTQKFARHYGMISNLVRRR